jgi:hypothetical protein
MNSIQGSSLEGYRTVSTGKYLEVLGRTAAFSSLVSRCPRYGPEVEGTTSRPRRHELSATKLRESQTSCDIIYTRWGPQATCLQKTFYKSFSFLILLAIKKKYSLQTNVMIIQSTLRYHVLL